MKIIFLNTWHGQLREDLQAYIHRHTQDVDVFCFQEALTHDGAASVVADALADYDAYHATKAINEATHQNSIYVKRGISVLHAGELLVGDGGMGLANYVVVETLASRLTICNVHGISQPGHKLDTPGRLRQSGDLISEFAYHEAVVIGGDFNLLPESESVHMFARHGYRNLIADYGIVSTRNEHAHARYPDNIQHYADYVFTSAAVGVRNFTVPSDIVSDHQPMEVSVELAGSKSFSSRAVGTFAPNAG